MGFEHGERQASTSAPQLAAPVSGASAGAKGACRPGGLALLACLS